MFPAAGELVHVGASVLDATVLHVAEGDAEREAAGQRLVQRGVGARRRTEDIGREHVRRVRRAVAAAEIEPFVAALRRAAEDAPPAGVERQTEVRHRDVLVELAIGGVGRECGRQQRAEHALPIGGEDARRLDPDAGLDGNARRRLPAILQVGAGSLQSS